MIQTFDEFIDLVNDNAVINKIPVNGTFELTQRCSLHCKMCFVCNPIEAAGEELSGAQWLDIMRQARDAGMVFAMLTGGEPMLHRDFREIYTGLRKLGVYVTLNSNGTTITPEVADFLKDNPPIRMQISLYGSSPEAYEKVTGSAAGFEKAIRGVELIRERGIDVRLRTILTRDTAEDMVNMVPLILSFGVPFGYGNYILPSIVDNGNDSYAQRLDGEELVRYSRLIAEAEMAYYEEHGDPRAEIRTQMMEEYRTAREKPIDPAREDLRKRANSARKETAFHCNAAMSRFSVTYDGFIRICEVTRDPSFDLKEMTFAEGFRKLGEAAALIPNCTECDGCPDQKRCSPCPPRHYVETGSYVKKADYVCVYTRAGIELRE